MSCLGSNRCAGIKRLFRTVPTKSESQTGVLIVSVLFAIVIGRLLAKISTLVVEVTRAKCLRAEVDLLEIVSKGEKVECLHATWLDALGERSEVILHLSIAVALIMTSAVGYYNSRQMPKLDVKFFNIPLLQALLDIAMVATYYLLVDLAEPSINQVSARPEAVLITIVFLLYVLWDFANYRVLKDEYSQVALRKVPGICVEYDYRRGVTLAFFAVIAGVTIIYLLLYSAGTATGRASTVAMDVFLLFAIIMYRAFKVLRDSSSYFRGETLCERPHDCKPWDRPTKITSDDLKRLLPEIDEFTRHMIRTLAVSQDRKIEISSDARLLTAEAYAPLMLSAAHSATVRRDEMPFFETAVTCSSEDNSIYQIELKLTAFGCFIAQILQDNEKNCNPPEDREQHATSQ
ncbi:hypothetical protein [Candidatus Poriferisodalis sp.]|uniref:hypothetical protein n=1 Tax=Candidatus Poriferisodalis sp. TaxID=3101277 RepID=UPI003B022403